MKNSLKLPLVFIANLIVWICLIAVFTQLGSDESLGALGSRNFLLFFINTVNQGLYLVPLSVMCALLVCLFYLMRHKTIIFISLPLVLIVSSLSVVFLVPFSYRMLDRFTAYQIPVKQGMQKNTHTPFSPGYIRKDSSYSRFIWFKVSDNQTEVSPIIVVNSQLRLGLPAMSVYPSGIYSPENESISKDSTVLIEKAGGKDTLVSASMGLPVFIKSFSEDIGTVLNVFRSSLKVSFIYYLIIYGSFIFSVISLWVLCFTTGWRLLNVFLVVSVFRLLFLYYHYSSGGKIFAWIKSLLPLSVSPSLISPVLYILFSVLLILAGSAVYLIRKLSRSGQAAIYE